MLGIFQQNTRFQHYQGSDSGEQHFLAHQGSATRFFDSTFAAQKGCLLSSSTPRIASGTRSCEFQPRNEINQSATRLLINNTPARVIFCENTGSSLHAKYANRIQYQSDFQASNKQKYVDSKDSCSSLALQL
ncbi:hypothetical protein VTO58DRAFT_111244 [Aureobasidium pullulans]